MPGKGRPFKKGEVSNPKGRPKGSKSMYKDMCWGSIGKIVKLVFHKTEPQMLKWIEENPGDLSRAETVLLRESNDVETIKYLITRVCGKEPQETTLALNNIPDEDLLEFAKEALKEMGEISED